MSSAKRAAILVDRELLEYFAGGQIFVPGTWVKDNLRATVYDLRMAADLMVVPDPPHFATGRYYRRGSFRRTDVILAPGDVAFVSSQERLCVPWNISGMVGSKFSLTSHGIITLTGLFIDPGFGLEVDDHGVWCAKSDQRLHFLIANVGPKPVVLRPGEQAIAAVQFSEIETPIARSEIRSVGFDNIEDSVLPVSEEVEAGLVFFRSMADLRGEFQRVQEQFVNAERSVAHLEARLRIVESGSNQVLMFGLYLMLITMLGVAVAIALSAIQVNDFDQKMFAAQRIVERSWWFIAVVAVAILAAAVWVQRAIGRLCTLALRVAGRWRAGIRK